MKSSGSSASWFSIYSLVVISCFNTTINKLFPLPIIIKKTPQSLENHKFPTCKWKSVSSCISIRKTLRQSIDNFLYSSAYDAKSRVRALFVRVWWCLPLASAWYEGFKVVCPNLYANKKNCLFRILHMVFKWFKLIFRKMHKNYFN